MGKAVKIVLSLYMIYIYTHIYTYKKNIYLYMCVYVCVCVYIYIYIYKVKLHVNLYEGKNATFFSLVIFLLDFPHSSLRRHIFLELVFSALELDFSRNSSCLLFLKLIKFLYSIKETLVDSYY